MLKKGGAFFLGKGKGDGKVDEGEAQTVVKPCF
jgi:hypothetical protein